MQPIDVFNNTIERSEYLLRLYLHLYNKRTRGIRSDWKEKFLKLMHWPSIHQIERIDSSDAIIVLKNNSVLRITDFESERMHELLRSSLVTCVSAYDRYIHERISKNVITALKARSLNKQQEEFSIPINIVMSITKRISEKRGQNIRPNNEIRNAIQDIIHKRPYQSWREIDYAFRLLGYNNLEKSLKHAYRKPDIDNEKKELNELAHRRNKIVHEGDIKRTQRGGRLSLNEISPNYVSDKIAFVKVFINKLETI